MSRPLHPPRPSASSGTRAICALPALIVDDDGDVLEALQTLVQDEGGHAVVGARNGAAALDFLLRPDVPLPCFIVLDLMMPVVSGWQVLSFLRTHDAWASIPVLVVSASSNRTTLDDPYAKRFLEKPLDPDVLLATVREVCCSGRRVARATAP
jgi:CheY-like chemotaxis protein